ncbi:hypothetical protein C7445_11612 [Alicyclobacillus sacchari]|uniref:Uncharacterized protein n=1 Tax=Alicyclobacillus sacchari TaxID=392010 RepID=A0A4V3HDU1_9BACL|nr:hypothetical protein [Alicyclobacillus sacchari]TDY42334.1 hypothetical protein C7445_11612 [Alicyclobacillus sacchari]GMA58011.1 hypothetical protein GCM10025858_25140 [Alicyclobacillus sacchari]
MDEGSKCDESVPSKKVRRSEFVREIVERLFDGCSVTFTVPHHVGTSLVHAISQGLQERGCYTLQIDLSDISTIEELAIQLFHGVLQLRTGVRVFSDKSMDGLSEYLSRPEINAKLRDLVDVPYLQKLTESPLALLDEGVSLLQRIPEESDTRLVVWFHEFQVIHKIDNLLLKRLRALFQYQSHVTYAFVGSDPNLMRTLFADRHQAFYRFATILKFPGE